MTPSKKPMGGLAILAFKDKGRKPSLASHDEPDQDEYGGASDDDEDNLGSGPDAAFASLADALNIPEEKRASAQEALHAYVKACSVGDYGKE